MSTFHPLAAALIGGLLFAGTAFAEAPKATVQASVTIEGKTIALPHARAFSTGMPYALIYFSEKPLDDFRYGSGGNTATWADGKYGTVLRLAPAVTQESADQTVVRYTIPEAKQNEDDRVEVRSPSVGQWQEHWLSQMGIQTGHLESSDGVMRGKLSWQGEGPVGAWSVEFSVPLEEGVL